MSKQDSPRVVGSDDWSFSGRWSARQGGFPALGVFLIVFGVLLVLGQFYDWAAYGLAAFFLAIGIVLIGSGLRDRSVLALYVGVFMTGLAIADFLTAAKVINGSGWGTLFVGIGFMLASLWRSSWGHRIGAGFVLGALLAIWGGIQVAGHVVNFPTDKLVGPVLIVLLGLWIVSRRMRA